MARLKDFHRQHLGTNSEPHRPENAAEHKTRALLTYTGHAGEHHRSDRPCW
jgi:hypothetical protein